MQKRFKVLVHTVGKADYENVNSYDSIEEAEAWVEWAKKNREEKTALGEDHYKNLDWDIVDLGKSGKEEA